MNNIIMSKNNSILVVNESDFEINSKLDLIIKIINDRSEIINKLDIELIDLYKNQIIQLEKQLINQSTEIIELKSQLIIKDKKIEPLEQIKSDFKLNQPLELNNKLKYNKLIRKKVIFPFMPLLSYDFILSSKVKF